MNKPDAACEPTIALAAEVALGLVTGPERAATLAHIEHCASCRELLDGLARTGDALLSVAPPGEPAEGFESRVLHRIDSLDRPARRRRGRDWRVAVGAVAAAVTLVVGMLVGAFAVPDAEASRGATMYADGGHEVGEIYLLEGDDPSVFVAVPEWAPAEGHDPWVYDLRLVLVDGDIVELPGVVLDAGAGAWGSMVDVDPDDVQSATLVGEDGRVWCSATF